MEQAGSRLHITHVIIVTSIASLTTIPGSSGTSLSSSGSILRWRRLVNWRVGLVVFLRPIGVVSAEFGVGASFGSVSYFFADYTFKT